ncbi:MAG TPA: helix-turn-helix transcriptional regulator [Trebonia sp.]|nr:helix-turn-helix transcriptional regulator [Trebonia sp.]
MEDTDNPSPAVQRRRLRTELRRARLEAGLTQEQVASAMDWSLSKLIRIENGSVGISTNDLKAVLQHYKITDEDRTAEFLAFSRASRERFWWSSYRDSISRRLIQLIEYENAADISRHYEDLVIPGLLQTTEYMRVSTTQLAPGIPASQVDTVVEVRLKRQELLRKPDGPSLFFVIDEAVVRRLVGGKDLMRRQLQRLIEAALMPNITVEVVPFTAGLLPGLQSPFVIHEFPDDADDDVLYLESPRGDLLSRDDADEVLRFRKDFERLRKASLGPEGTTDFLREVIAGLS